MPAAGKIFQASDLNQRGRSILDLAREGEAHVRDKDGLSLVMLPERRLEALKAVARAAANLFAIELALAQAGDHRLEAHELVEWTWLREFDNDDLQEFLGEMRHALLLASREENDEPIDDTLYRWKVTAQALSDPVRRQILMSPHSNEDFVEARRPE